LNLWPIAAKWCFGSRLPFRLTPKVWLTRKTALTRILH